MASKGVSTLKFVGTVSLGLLTGLSYSLSAISVPSILSLPSAASASRAFQSLLATSTLRTRALTGLSTASLLLAFVLSPRAHRHPYLLYTSILGLTAGLSEYVTPYIISSASEDSSRRDSAARMAALRERFAARDAARAARLAKMETSYEILGDNHSEGTGSASGGEDLEFEEETLNGEEVRGEVLAFRKTQYVQTGIASLGFLLAVVGIWGDGAVRVFYI
ncbi:hypothetical protein B0T11DRAFT_324210 [Plectosphaerella cucumerina]|uniref:Autophagy-related protein 33 n=1 Tax=Plectosphaerella cucumerina TaxID=40658 RepID=A0A8K0TQK8_9PEZI|nr:hypothetical protein B0T11DRAFT_324210 [Plectosphaerella cucumerina]